VLHLEDGTNDLGTVTFTLSLGRPTVAFSEDFNSVVVPGLPVDWLGVISGAGSSWATTVLASDLASKAAFAADPDSVSDNLLISPAMTLTSSQAQLSFRHSYDLEVGGGTTGFDGGVLEISINGAAFTDILGAGGSFLSHGYDSKISTRYQNPLAGRDAWSGDSGGFVTTVVGLPPSAAGFPIQLRWRLGSDRSNSGTGWYVDDVLVLDGYSCCHSLVAPRLVDVRRVGGNVVFSFDSVAGQSYVVEATTDLAHGPWTEGATKSGDGSVQSYTNATAGVEQRFFRLRTQ
jgi:hypothetical protein